MRIIAGKYKGHPVKFPNSKLVRPTTDRNKESMFSTLNNYIDFEDLLVCDIYAGSGSLGLEALSRGAKEVHFVEKNFKVSKTLKENIAKLNANDYCRVILTSAIKFCSTKSERKYDLIFADPPFFKDDIHEVVKNIFENELLTDNGILLVERSIQTKDNDIKSFGKEPIKRLGDSLIYIF
jgi:16S rRNA (guanine966-N2)-methyltransferase